MENGGPWYEPVWQEFERSFQQFWVAKVGQFNETEAVKKAESRFYLPRPSHPPAWFNGDIEALKAGEWVLVVSINPHINPAAPVAYDDDGSPKAWWDYWRTFNLHPDNWSGQFFPRLVRLAAAALGADVPASSEAIRAFASRRMLFVEFCPYASQRWPDIAWDPHMKRIAQSDDGFRIARKIRKHIFDFGQPKLVLCNGKFATWDVKDQQFGVNRMFRMAVELKHQRGPEAFIYEGLYEPKIGAPFRVLGFNQLSSRMPNRDVVEAVIVEMALRGSDSPALVAIPCPRAWETAPPNR